MRTPPRSARTYHRRHRKRERRRKRMGSWRSRRCWCSTWKTRKPSPYRWRGRSLSSTPCSTGKPLQVERQHPAAVELNVFNIHAFNNRNLCLQWSRRLCSFAWQYASLVSPTRSVGWERCCHWSGQLMLPLKTLWYKPTGACIWTPRETPPGLWNTKHIRTTSLGLHSLPSI